MGWNTCWESYRVITNRIRPKCNVCDGMYCPSCVRAIAGGGLNEILITQFEQIFLEVSTIIDQIRLIKQSVRPLTTMPVSKLTGFNVL